MNDFVSEIATPFLFLAVNIADVEKIVAIVASVIIIVATLASFVLKIVEYLKDGKIDDDELKTMKNDLDNLGETIKNGFGRNDD